MSIICPHKILYRCVMVEDGDIVKMDRGHVIVVYGIDICDLSRVKRHNCAFFRIESSNTPRDHDSL